MTTLPTSEQEIPAINDTHLEWMMCYLRDSSDTSIEANRRSANLEEDEVAMALLSIPLKGGDCREHRRSDFADSNYGPDVLLREKAFQECGLTGLDITRHDIILYAGTNQLAVKVINITKMVGDRRVDIPGGILLLGKIVFNGGPNATYEVLTTEEFERVKRFVEQNRQA